MPRYRLVLLAGLFLANALVAVLVSGAVPSLLRAGSQPRALLAASTRATPGQQIARLASPAPVPPYAPTPTLVPAFPPPDSRTPTPAPPAATPPASPSGAPATPTAGPTSPSRTPAPVPTLSGRAVVANTGGRGANLRSAPSTRADRLAVWPDQTVLTILDPPTSAEGGYWYRVRDPQGNVGWILGDLLQAP